MKRWKFWLPLLLFASFAALAFWRLSAPDDHQIASAMVGKPMPQIDLPPAVEGMEGLASSDLADGNPKLVNIFASWCVPCAVEAPQLEQLKQQGVQIYGIAIRDTPEDVQRFLDRYGNPFARIGADTRSKVQIEMGSSGVPESFVIDGKGRIVYQHIGDIRPDQVAMILEKLEQAR